MLTDMALHCASANREVTVSRNVKMDIIFVHAIIFRASNIDTEEHSASLFSLILIVGKTTANARNHIEIFNAETKPLGSLQKAPFNGFTKI